MILQGGKTMTYYNELLYELQQQAAHKNVWKPK